MMATTEQLFDPIKASIEKRHEFIEKKTSQIMQILEGCTIGEATDLLDKTKLKLKTLKVRLDDQM